MRTAYLCLGFLFPLMGCNVGEDKLFEKVGSDETNIIFRNDVVSNDSLNAFTFTNFYNGGGVGIGDFNNDGLSDLFFTGNQVSSRMYLNMGEFKFEDVTQSAGLITNVWCNGVSVVDINNDGWDDLYVAVAYHKTMANTKNLLFINQKTKLPTFKEQAAEYGLDYAGYSTQSVFLDYDRDSDLDMFLLNTSPDTQNPSYQRVAISNGTHPSASKLYQNVTVENGNPKFVDVSAKAGILNEGLGLGVVVSDWNNDGWPDIYCSNDFMSSDVLYLNKGDGTFKDVVRDAMPHTSLSGMGIDAADINMDGQVDIFQLDMLPEDNARQKQMLGRQDYDRKEMSVLPPYNYQLQYMRNMLQVNLGNSADIPQFADNGLLAGVAKTDWSWGTLLCDLDNDNQKDIFITNGYRKNVTDLDFISYFKSNSMFGSNEFRKENRENLMDKVPEIPLKNYAFRNLGDMKFENVSQQWGLDELSYANGTAYADLDNDGDLDLVVNNLDSEASIFRNKTTQNKSIRIEFEGSPKNLSAIGAKVEAWVKGKKMVFENYPVRGYLSSVQKGILIGVGSESLLDSLTVIWPERKVQKLKSVTGNLKLKYTDAKDEKSQDSEIKRIFEIAESQVDYKHQESDFNDFNETASLHKMMSKSGPAVAQADINADGMQDFVVGGAYRGSPTMIYTQTSKGVFSKKQEILTSQNMEIGAATFFDADQDGDQDLILTGGSCERPLQVWEAYQPQLWLNDGKGNFGLSQNLPKLGVSSQAIVPLDIDNDKDVDIFIGGRIIPHQYPSMASSYILRNDKGIFRDVTAEVAPFLRDFGMVCDAIKVDLNKDAYPEIALVGEWMPLMVLNNLKGKLEAKPVENTEGWWNTIAAADLNQDGQLDFLLGNEGLNTFYRADAQKPVVLLAEDFDNDQKLDPVMGHYLQNRLVPVHPRENLNLQIIGFRRKYITYKDYSKAGFDDLFTDEEKNGVLRLEAKELLSCLAFGDKKGGFTFKPLPWQAQTSPIYSFVVDDFNHDGHLDVVCTGNFYANEAHQGRQDASRGTLLLGNGKGDFKTTNFQTSGLNLSGDTRKSLYFKESGTLLAFFNSGKAQTYKLK
jgi:enediyne biosynthesis protein E4